MSQAFFSLAVRWPGTMGDGRSKHVEDLRGAATRRRGDPGVTELVEAMHRTIAGGPASSAGRSAPGRLVTGLVYGSVRGVTRWSARHRRRLSRSSRRCSATSAPGPEREAVLAALNGVLGDYLVETGNPLAIEMRRAASSGGSALALEPRRCARAARGARQAARAGPRLVMNDLQMDPPRPRPRRGAGARPRLHAGLPPLQQRPAHLDQRRAARRLLERWSRAWPVPRRRARSSLGHSMGGLVARSACHVGEAGRARAGARSCAGWSASARRTTARRSSAAATGSTSLLGVSRYSAPLARLGKLRSAGVTDLRYGNVLDEHWHGRDRFALGATRAARCRCPPASPATPSPAPCPQADGRHLRERRPGARRQRARPPRPRRAMTLAFPPEHQWIALRACGHLDLLAPEVYETLRAWLST